MGGPVDKQTNIKQRGAEAPCIRREQSGLVPDTPRGPPRTPPPPQRCDVRRRGAALPSSQGLAAPSPSFDLYRSRTRRATQRHWPPLPWAGLHCAGPPSSVDRASSRCSIRAPWLLGRVSISTAAHRLGVARGADPCSSLLQGAMKQLEQ